VEGFLLFIPVLACPVGMALMMWLMAKGMRMGIGAKNDPLKDVRAAPEESTAEKKPGFSTLEDSGAQARLLERATVRFAQQTKKPAEVVSFD
jgi:hypothetical protein